MENEKICKNCGSPKPDLPPFGSYVAVHNNDAVKLVKFFRGELDVEKCNVCGEPYAIPSLILSFDNYTEELIFWSPLAREHPDFMRPLEEDAVKNGTAIVSGFETPEQLREAAWERLMPRAEVHDSPGAATPRAQTAEDFSTGKRADHDRFFRLGDVEVFAVHFFLVDDEVIIDVLHDRMAGARDPQHFAIVALAPLQVARGAHQLLEDLGKMTAVQHDQAHA